MLPNPSRAKESHRRAGRTALTAAAVAVVAMSFAEETFPATTAAPRPGASSVVQYIELVPTAGGPIAPGIAEERRLPLSPKAKRALGGIPKPTADSLLTVATSSTYGAPSQLGTGASGQVIREAGATTRSPSRNQSLEAIAAVVAPSGDMRMIGLLLFVVAVTVAAGALSLRRRLSRYEDPG